MTTFNPSTKPVGVLVIPYFEDARADFAPNYASQKTIDDAKSLVITEMLKQDALVLSFLEGDYGSSPKRYGYKILFTLGGTPGEIPVAGLPIRGEETARKMERVRVQALLCVADWIKAGVTQRVFSPGSHPLLMCLLMPGTKMTVGQYILDTSQLALPSPQEPDDAAVIEGEFSESVS